MGFDETHQVEAKPTPPVQPPAPPVVERKPLLKPIRPIDPVKRQQTSERNAVLRQVRKLKAEKTIEDLWRKADELRGKLSPSPAPSGPTVGEAPPALPALEPHRDPAVVALYTPIADQIFTQLAVLARGTRFDFDVRHGKQINGTAQLTQAAAPVMAKRLPTMVATPEGLFAFTAAMLFIPPSIEWGAQKIAAQLKMRREERAAEQLAVATGDLLAVTQ